MFGFSKKEREENQKAEAIEDALFRFDGEFRIALATTAEAYGISAYPSGDKLKEERFLVVLAASAISIGKFFDAEQQTIKKGLRKHFSSFPDGEDALQMAWNSEILDRHDKLTENTYQVWYLIYNHQGKGINVDREKLLMGLSQIYLGV